LNYSDSDLKKGLKAGDRDLFREVFLNTYPGMVRYSTGITGDAESAKEVVQDIFLELWEKREFLVISGSLKSYLFGAVYNRSVNWLRNKKIREAYSANPSDVTLWMHLPSDPATSDPLLLEQMEKAIEDLPPKCREAFTRTIIDGEPQKIVAASLGLSAKTIENQVSRARKILKSKLAKIIGH
jgi:RNA polymerase sigma-70 factor (ECF subfamily)